jgi:16S rRNA (uracil1498-N3)-methyltransferase
MLYPGDIPLPPDAAHHLRDVLRLGAGASVELFDAAGNTADGVLVAGDSPKGEPGGRLLVRVNAVVAATRSAFRCTIASAIPKGNRADWMIEKLSELGVATLIPLQTGRSVVHPEGAGKIGRWERLANESAKQCRRNDVMRIEPLEKLEAVLDALAGAAGPEAGPMRPVAWYFSTEAGAIPVAEAIARFRGDGPAREEMSAAGLTCFIGPEGGWTEDEIRRFDAAGVLAVRLTRTILRIETAALAAAAVIDSMLERGRDDAAIAD